MRECGLSTVQRVGERWRVPIGALMRSLTLLLSVSLKESAEMPRGSGLVWARWLGVRMLTSRGLCCCGWVAVLA